ncbi:unnamed protein product [Enterobius vermicularis]|uniref:Acyl-CoA_dh_1 domain-containing protein n=1 Tax=Enterobius vermicularis TaxID=51028 RepID=A0A0N4VEY5_ENTVE|nr:unnamed protein product [Enterobius vermicularis]
MAAKNITYAAAVTGFMRSLIGKEIMTDLALNTFVLESMAYYIGGMQDEELILTVDVENAVVHVQAIAIIEVVGINSCECQFEYEKILRDLLTVASLGNSRTNVTDLIAMNVITSWANTNATSLQKIRSGAAGLFGSMFGVEWRYRENPKLKHYIAEHAHPSLQQPCEDLEYTMSRLNGVIGAIVRREGKTVTRDFFTLTSIANVIEINLAMMATIARASRSYCIGLRNSDIEFAAYRAKTELQMLSKFFGLIQMTPAMLEVGRTVLDNKGFCLESPTELNW